MKKKALIPLILSLLVALPLPVYAMSANDEPTNDINKKIELSTSATDNITSSSDLSYAWFYLDESEDPAVEVRLSGTEDSPYVKGLSSIQITYTKHGNGKYIARCVDENGNKSEESIVINAWDITPPAITDYSISETRYSKVNEITVEDISDNLSLSDEPYKLSEVSALSDYTYVSEGTFTAQNSFLIRKNGFYELMIRDLAGNTKATTFEISNIDTNPPVYGGLTLQNDGGVLKATVSASDAEEDTSKLKYCISPSYDAIDANNASIWQSSPVFTKDINNNNLSDLTGGITSDNCFVGILDEAGNVTISAARIDAAYILGNLAPTAVFAVNYEELPAAWTNDSITLVINPVISNRVNLVAYKFGSEDWQTNHVHVYTENTVVDVSVKDEYGNVYTASSFHIDAIDKADPVISAEFANDNHNAWNITASDNGSGIKSISLIDAAGEESVVYTGTKKAIPASTSTSVPSDSKTLNNVVIPSLGEYTIRIEDYAGNAASITQTITDAKISHDAFDDIDSYIYVTPEQWTNGSDSIRLGTLSSAMLEDIGYHAPDGTVSVANYALIDKDTDPADASVAWQASPNFTVSANGQFYYCIKTRYGEIIKSSLIDITNIDKTIPGITATLNDKNNKITVTATDSLSKVSKIAVRGGSYTEDTVIKDAGTNAVSSLATTFVVPASDATYVFTAYDKAENTNTISVNVGTATTDNVDLTPANLKSHLFQSPAAWTNGNVILTLALSNTSDLAAVPYSWDNGSTWVTVRSNTYTENGSYSVKVKDSYGNIITSDAQVIDNIDKVLPTITATPNEKKNLVRLAVGDSNSGLQKATVLPTGGTEETLADYSTRASATETYVVPANGEYTFTVYDKAGNTASASVTIEGAVTDNAELEPDALAAKILKTPDTWTNGNVKLKLALDSTADLADAPYKWTGQSAYGTNNEFIVSVNGTYSVTVKDKYGNEITSSEVTVSNIDKAIPTLTFSANENGNKLLFTATDAFSKMQKITVEGGSYTDETTIKDANGSLLYGTLAISWRVPISNTTYTIRAYDNAGNVKEQEITVGIVTTDNTNLTPANLLSSITRYPTGWTNGDVTLTLALSNTTDLAENPYSWDDGDTWGTTRTHTCTENGSYTVKVKDMYGNIITSNPYVVSYIDKTAPSITATANDKQNIVTVMVGDSDSRLQKITVTPDGGTEETIADFSAVNLTSATENYSVPSNNTYTFKVYDKAGNVSSRDVEITGAETDNEELTADVLASRIIKNPSAWTNGTVKLKLALNSTAGLAAAPYKWTGQEDFNESNEFTVSVNGTYTVIVKDAYGNEIESGEVVVNNIDKVLPSIFYSANENSNKLMITGTDSASKMQKITIEGGTYTDETTIKDAGGSLAYGTLAVSWDVPVSDTVYTIRAYDNAGNVEEETVTVGVVTTDNTDLTPQALASNIVQTPTTWTNQNVVLTLALSNTNSLASQPYSWDDGETWTTDRSKVVTANGSYAVRVKDMYGNVITSDAHTVANIDKVLPTITATLNDNGNKVTISVSDDYSKLQKVTVTPAESDEETVYDCSALEKYADSVEYIVPQNGEYVFKVYDKAGNVASSTITVDGAITDNSELTAATIAGRVLKTPATWTNEPVKLKLALNSTAGLAEAPYKWTGQSEYGTSNEFTVTVNGSYTVTVKDAYGNEIVSDPIVVDYIDTTAPYFEVGMNDQHNNLELSLSDEASGLRKVTISGTAYTEETTLKEYTDPAATSTVSIPVPSLGDYTIKAYDYAGNASAALIQITEAYTDNPELNPTVITSRLSIDNEGWTNRSVTMTLALRSLRGLADQPYMWSNIGTYGTSNQNTVTENGSYTVTVKDKYGNEFTSAPINVTTIDTVLPTAAVNLSTDGTTAIITSSDANSGIARVLWESETLGGLVSIKEYTTPVLESSVSVAIPNNGDYSIYVFDAAGNKTTVPLHVENISAPNPLLSPVGIRSSIRKSPTNWTNGDVTLSVDLENQTGVASNGYIWESTAPTGANYLNTPGTHTTLVVTDNGIVNLVVTDVYGQVYRSEDIEVDNIDKTAPEVTLTKDQANNIVVSASDDLSGIEKVVCSLQGRTGNDTRSYGNYINTAEATFTISENGTYNVVVYDHAGNTTTETIEITDARGNYDLTDEDVTRAITLSTVENTNKPVTLECALTNTLGLADEPYSWDGGSTWSASSSHTVTENGDYTLLVKDLYGNVLQGTVHVGNIDKSAPSLTVSQVGNAVAVSVSDTKGTVAGMLDRITAIAPNSTYETIIADYNAGRGNIPKSNDTLNFEPKQDGEWKFVVYDSAGNKTEKTLTVSGVGSQNTIPGPVESSEAVSGGGSNTGNTTTTTNVNSSAGTETVREEYHYNTTKETPMYLKESATPINNRTVVQPTPVPTKVVTPVVTPTPTPTPVANPETTAPASTVAKKVTNNNASTTTTVAKANSKVTATVVEESPVKADEDDVRVEEIDTTDAREMYRNTRIEGDEEEASTTSKKPLLITLAVILGVCLIGGLIYLIVRIREKKRYRYDQDFEEPESDEDAEAE